MRWSQRSRRRDSARGTGGGRGRCAASTWQSPKAASRRLSVRTGRASRPSSDHGSGSSGRILLLDEPLASLDPLARREFLHVLVEAVRAEGHTALLSSHVITDIEQACDRLIVLGKGHTLLDLSIAEALAHHRVLEGPVDPAIAADRVVGAFPSPAGEPLTLIRVRSAEPIPPDGVAGERPATLE